MEGGAPLCNSISTPTGFEEAEVLGIDDLGDGETIVDLRQIDIPGTPPGLSIGGGGGLECGAETGLRFLPLQGQGITAVSGSRDANSTVTLPHATGIEDIIGGQYQKGCTIGEQGTVEETQGIRDPGAPRTLPTSIFLWSWV